MITATKQLNNKEVSTVLKKFVSSSDMRPVLTYAHLENEFVYATDSHHLIRIKKSIIEGFSDNTESTFFNPRTSEFEEVDGNYPDTSRLMPTGYSVNEEFSITKDQLNEMHKSIRNMKEQLKSRGYNFMVQIKSVAGQLILKGINRINREEETTFYPTGIHADNISIHVNAAFLLNAITSFKKGMSITRDKEVTVQYQGTLKPLYMTLPNDEMSALILPIRV